MSYNKEDWIQPDGSLESTVPWVYWRVGSEHISLDSDFFTVEELEWIAAHVKSKQTTPEPPQKVE